MSRIDNNLLVDAGLETMRQSGQPLTKLPAKGRSMLYTLPNGESVRARTCNDHILIVVASEETEGARLNIEGTDWLLIVMPETERTDGKVIVYLVPSKIAADAARRTHADWLATNPNTKGSNTTWNLWFDPDGPAKANDFAKKWETYRIPSDVTTLGVVTVANSPSGGGGNIKAEVEAARNRVAMVAGVAPEAVKISIDFGT